MLGSLGNRPFQDSAVVTCPVNGLRVEDALERSLDTPEGVCGKAIPVSSVSDGLSPVK